jgi:hypothetical protein
LPKKVKAIVRFETDCGNGRLNIYVGWWQQAWEDFHKCCSDFGIAKHSKSWWAETLKVEGEFDRVKRHEREKVSGRQLLELVIEINCSACNRIMEHWEVRKGLLQDIFDGRVRPSRARIDPTGDHLLVYHHNVIIAKENFLGRFGGEGVVSAVADELLHQDQHTCLIAMIAGSS